MMTYEKAIEILAANYKSYKDMGCDNDQIYGEYVGFKTAVVTIYGVSVHKVAIDVKRLLDEWKTGSNE